MLYHDPELCAFLDTKKVSPDSYAHLWVSCKLKLGEKFFLNKLISFISFLKFRSLFSANTELKVVLSLWDVYFQLGDQFLVFFMSLILVFNFREEIMSAVDQEKADLISKLQIIHYLYLNLIFKTSL